MSEKIYALLFRVFPARFRTSWREEALELLHDRLENERGVRARLCLWFDLIADLAASAPGAWLRDRPALAPLAPAHPEGVPKFQFLEERSISPSSYFYGSVLSILLLTGVTVLLKHGGHFPILRPSAAEQAGGVTLDPWATGHGTGSGVGPELIANGNASPSATKAGSGSASAVTVHVREEKPLPLFDEAERGRVLKGIIVNLEQHDPDASAAMRAAMVLRADEALGRYRSIGDPGQFAVMVTRQIREAAGDEHLEVAYSDHVLPSGPPASSPAEDARYRAALLASNCGFTAVKTLPGNVGYLKLDLFPPVEVCGDTAIAAMKTLSRDDAVIIDLRDNSGGDPAMVMFLADWLFDKPAFFYNPRENDAARMWTRSPMAGSDLPKKPLYVLTSSRTYSAAEHFSYNLKMLHRATLVGETTGGATDVGVFHRIDDHFGIGIRESRVPNPYSTPDWSVNGVQPDIQVPAAAALETAEKAAHQQLGHR